MNRENGIKHGQEGCFSLPGYFTHTGEFTDGQMTGKGRREWIDGRVYEGEWIEGEMHGKGSWSNTTTNETYDGDFVGNKRHGRGTVKLGNGDIYDGNFELHRYHGRGAYLKEKHFVIDGYFKNGFVEGTAKATWHKQGYYEGPWEQGRMKGQLGQFSAVDGSYQYIGAFENAKPIIKPTEIFVRIDRTVVPTEAATETGKKATKAPAKKGKDPNAELASRTVTVSQGSMVGALHIALAAGSKEDSPAPTDLISPVVSNETPVQLPSESLAFGGIPLPMNELRRRVAVRMRPYIPPPAPPEPAKGAKGKPVETEPVSTEPPPPPPAPVPIWLKQPSLGLAADSWSRYPPNCVKFRNGICGRSDVSSNLVKRSKVMLCCTLSLATNFFF